MPSFANLNKHPRHPRSTEPATTGRVCSRRLAAIVTFSALSLAGAPGAEIVAEWPLDEGGGQIALDFSGNGNDGQFGSSPGVDENDPSPITGPFGAPALSFDGNDFIEVQNAPSLQPATVTVEAWVRSLGSPGIFRYIISKGAEDCLWASYALYTAANGGLIFYIKHTAGWFAPSPNAGTGVWDGEWHHVAGVFDGNTVKLYVDGVQVPGATPAHPIEYGLPDNDRLYIGNFRGTCDFPFQGDIARVLLWSCALSDEEIAIRAIGNHDPTADAGSDITVECTGSNTPVTLDGTNSSDPDGDPLSFLWTAAAGSGIIFDDPNSATPTGQFPVGPTLITLTVTDGKGGLDVTDVLVTVQDTTPPVVICTTDEILLWPPNHSMRPVEIEVAVTDACAPVTDVVCWVSSNEPDDATGDGSFTGDVDGADGHSAPVAVTLTYDAGTESFRGTVILRAERDAAQDGRVYSFLCDVTDPAGNTSTSSCVVVVPHNKG